MPDPRTIPVITRREQIGRLRLKSRRTRQVQDRLLAVAIVVGGILVSAWALMIPVGIAHRDWWHLMPSMGYGTAVAITMWPFLIGAAITIVLEAIRG